MAKKKVSGLTAKVTSSGGKALIGGAVVVVALVVALVLALLGGSMALLGIAGSGGSEVAQMVNNDDLNGGSGGGSCSSSVSSADGSVSSGTSGSDAVNANVKTIIGVGKGLGISSDGIKIALVTAMKESSLLNLANDGVHGSEDNGGSWPAEGVDHYLAIAKKSLDVDHDGSYVGTDHDSVGLFQQRVAYWWPGSYSDEDALIKTMMDPQYQATVFFIGIHGDGGLKGKTDVWNQTGDLSGAEVNSAVQAVQGAAAGTVGKAQTFWDQATAYYNANKDTPAIAESSELKSLIGTASAGKSGTTSGSSSDDSGSSCSDSSSGTYDLSGASGIGKKILEVAYKQDKYPYQWGGGDTNGPTVGQNKWPGVIGFDCSGLVLYSIYQATGGKVSLPHQSGSQETTFRSNGWMVQDSSGTQPPSDAQPGDIAFFGGSHVAIYAGVIDGKPMYFQAGWNHKATLGSDDTDIAFGDVGRQYTSWGRVGGK